MKKLFLGLATAVAVFGFVGCGGKEDKVKAFAEDFGAKASKNQLDSLKLLYPVLDADSVAMVYTVDSISIAEGEKPGTFVVNYGNGVTVNVKESEDGNVTATSSKGLYAFKADDLKFAKATGMYDAKLVDKTLKNRMDEIPAVKEHAKKAYEAANKPELKVTSTVTGQSFSYAGIRTIHLKVTNMGNVPVKGKDYGIGAKIYWMDAGEPHSVYRVAEGKDVPVGGSVTISKTIMGDGQATGIVWKNKKASIDFDKEYNPTGKEYEAYLKSKKKDKK